MNYTVIRTSDDHLEHHGILGMKWGVWNDETRARRQGKRKNRIQKGTEQHQERIRKNKERWNNPKLKAVAKTGTAVVASLLAGYGLLKLDKVLADKRFANQMAKYPSKASSPIPSKTAHFANGLNFTDWSQYTMDDLRKLDLY